MNTGLNIECINIRFILPVMLVFCTACSLGKKTDKAASETRFRFDFGSGKVETGFTRVTPDVVYTSERGYGFYTGTAIKSVNRTGKNALTDDYCTADTPFYFSVKVPEGSYEVVITFGDRAGETSTTVKSESRRLMLRDVATTPGAFVSKTIAVNVRNKHIRPGLEVKLTSRETYHLNWDDRLTLEFDGGRPAVCAVEIRPAGNIPTVYLAGNSTVTDQQNEPWSSWGQMLPCFFKPGIVIANHAESGESLKRFSAEHRLEKIASTLKAGDYLLIQFGHNDQKKQSSAYVAPFEGYQEQLRLYIGVARKAGAQPLLVTPVQRRTFDAEGKIENSHGDYPEAMRQVALEEGVPCIDLNAMSAQLFEALGPEASKKAFVHFPAGAFPGQTEALADDSHFSTYGAYELAKCIVQGIKTSESDLARYLNDDLPAYDPAHPAPFETWSLPLSPLIPSVDRF